MISPELSTIRQKDLDRDWIARATAEYEQGTTLETLITQVRDVDFGAMFNGKSRDGTRAEPNPSFESKVAAAAPTLTVTEAMKTFHLCERDLKRMASRMGFKFKRGYTTNQGHKATDGPMVERIIALRDVGLNRSQVMKQTGMCYEKFHRLLKDYGIDFPPLPFNLRNGKTKR
ncbi:hypothetical protein [Pseudomonas sp. KBW05]|uniref:hypothetical protein n=1 Tax=Pseudomonas sp. KBW05 TaxID=2153360 RepID=UPI000F5A51CD|nr:hypothetical protein [Pseudomonas sp. KBW05]RQO62272.1 hypothetical protein DBR46_00850 [Pseudomonas sp. KBW05]